MGTEPFCERPLHHASYDAVAQELLGRDFIRCNSSYGSAISLHFGPLIPKRVRRARVQGVPNRGAWVLTSWICELIYESDEGAVHHTENEGAEFCAQMKNSLGHSVSDVTFTIDPLVLSLSFSNGARLRVVADRTSPGDAWLLSLPNHDSVNVQNAGTWSWERVTALRGEDLTAR
jgi:hypothetical protein